MIPEIKETTNVKTCNLAYVTSLVYNLVMCTIICLS